MIQIFLLPLLNKKQNKMEIKNLNSVESSSCRDESYQQMAGGTVG